MYLKRIESFWLKIRKIPLYHYIGIGAFAVLIVLQMSNFMTAFRITDDDNLFYFSFLSNSFKEYLQEAWKYAVYSGRIYHLYVYPFSGWSNYLLNFSFFQYLTVALTAWYSLSAAWWLSKYAGKQITLLSVLLFFTLLPIGSSFWPPNSYGYLMIIFSGIYWTRLVYRYSKNKYILSFTTFLSVFIVMGWEYNLFLFPLVLAVEYFKDLKNVFYRKNSIKDFLARKEIKRDLLILGIAWFGYLSFYFLFPTQYMGNKVTWAPLPEILEVQGKHIFNGLSLKFINWQFRPFLLTDLPWGIIISSILAGSYVFKFSSNKKQKLTGLFWGFSVAFISTFLLAIVEKYRKWCADNFEGCYYVDSRVAIIGVVTFIAVLLLLLAYHFKKVIPTIIVLIITIISASTYSYNKKKAETQYAPYLRPFDIARKYTCFTLNTSLYDSLFAKTLTRVGRMNFDRKLREKYWYLHVQKLRKSLCFSCKDIPPYPLGKKLSFQKSMQESKEKTKVSPFSLFGWSLPERWGTWSDGNSAVILLKLPEIPQKDLSLTMSFTPYITSQVPRQTVIVKFFNTPLDTFVFTERKAHTIHLKIPKNLFKDNYLPLLFTFPNAIPPMDAGEPRSKDYRKLGIMLYSLQLKENGKD